MFYNARWYDSYLNLCWLLALSVRFLEIFGGNFVSLFTYPFTGAPLKDLFHLKAPFPSNQIQTDLTF